MFASTTLLILALVATNDGNVLPFSPQVPPTHTTTTTTTASNMIGTDPMMSSNQSNSTIERRVEVDELTAKQMERFSAGQMDTEGHGGLVLVERPNDHQQQHMFAMSTMKPPTQPDIYNDQDYADNVEGFPNDLAGNHLDYPLLPYGYEDKTPPGTAEDPHLDLHDFLTKIEQGRKMFKTELIKDQLYKCVLVPKTAKTEDVFDYFAHKKLKKAKKIEKFHKEVHHHAKMFHEQKNGHQQGYQLFRVDINRLKPKDVVMHTAALLQDDADKAVKTMPTTSTPTPGRARSITGRKINRIGQLKTIFRNLKENFFQLLCPTPEDCFDSKETNNMNNQQQQQQQQQLVLTQLLQRIKASDEKEAAASGEDDDDGGEEEKMEPFESTFLEDYIQRTKDNNLYSLANLPTATTTTTATSAQEDRDKALQNKKNKRYLSSSRATGAKRRGKKMVVMEEEEGEAGEESRGNYWTSTSRSSMGLEHHNHGSRGHRSTPRWPHKSMASALRLLTMPSLMSSSSSLLFATSPGRIHTAKPVLVIKKYKEFE